MLQHPGLLRLVFGFGDGSGILGFLQIDQLLAALEPHFPWVKDELAIRARCYGQMHHPLAARARTELAQFNGNEAARFAYQPWPAMPRVSAREPAPPVP